MNFRNQGVSMEQQTENEIVSAFADLRCETNPSLALIAIGPRGRSVGSIVAEARGRLAQRSESV